jgi:transketolase
MSSVNHKDSKPLTEAELDGLAKKLRFRTIRNSYLTGTPHLGSCLSCIDLLVYLYWNVLRVHPDAPSDPSRDRLILSKGHAAPALFQVLAERGYFPVSDLDNYGHDGSIFGEHPPTPSHLAGIEAATGSLGHGLPMGLGMAIASAVTKTPYHVYVILGDGECNEGSVWEAAMLAAAQKVSNLTVLIDFNKWQATGRSEEIMSLAPLADKWRAFGWDVTEIDGHSFKAIATAIEDSQHEDRPKAIVAHTVKGRGVSFMQDDNNWHYRIPSTEEVYAAAAELRIPEGTVDIQDKSRVSHG